MLLFFIRGISMIKNNIFNSITGFNYLVFYHYFSFLFLISSYDDIFLYKIIMKGVVYQKEYFV